MKKGLFVNTQKELCSIYESGMSIYNCLASSINFDLDYVEISSSKRKILKDYDFYVFNYHWVKMGWLNTKKIKKLKGAKFCIVLESFPNNPLKRVQYKNFDSFLVIDPSGRSVYKNVHFLPRPLLNTNLKSRFPNTDATITIGSYGINFEGKGYERVVRAANNEFDDAIININIPSLNDESKSKQNDLLKNLHSNNPKNLTINITSHNFSRKELTNWCSQNSINIFLYDREIGTGLSASVDQAIESGRPILVSTNTTFRHLHEYVTPYPFQNIAAAISNGEKNVLKIKKEWNEVKFKNEFEKVLNLYNIAGQYNE